mgnify:CR=1 FL=1
MSSHQSQVAIPETRVSGKAILALCIGVLTLGVAFGRLALGSERDWGIITLLIVGSILSLLFCHLANGEARQSNHTLAGIGAAKVGLWLASLGFVFSFLSVPMSTGCIAVLLDSGRLISSSDSVMRSTNTPGSMKADCHRLQFAMLTADRC